MNTLFHQAFLSALLLAAATLPADAVVGKPLFILHPFTSHWGPAK